MIARSIVSNAIENFTNGLAMLVHRHDIGLTGNSYAIQVRVDTKESHLIMMGTTVAQRKGNKITVAAGTPAWMVDEITTASYSIDDLPELMG